MKKITIDERPIGKGYTGYDCFYSEDIVKETEKAFLVSIFSESKGYKYNRWLPKSKTLAYYHTDNREIIYNGRDYVKNINYGKERVQYFISCFFTQDKGTIFRTDIKSEYKDFNTDNEILGVKGIDY